MAQVMVPVSVGEIVDKYTILRIKAVKIADAQKVSNVKKELEALVDICHKSGIDLNHGLVEELEGINNKLWVIEDDIRDKERNKAFDDTFISLARSVYVTNDERFRVKSEINKVFGSEFHEEKSYEAY